MYRLLIGLLIVLSGSNLYAQNPYYGIPRYDGFYVEIGGGSGLENSIDTYLYKYKYKRKYFGEASIGYRKNNYRFELCQIYKKDSLHSYAGEYFSSGDLIEQSTMLNVYLDGYNKTHMTSFVGLGTGVSSLSISDTYSFTKKDASIPTFQSLIGFGYMFNQNLTLSLKYRLR